MNFVNPDKDWIDIIGAIGSFLIGLGVLWLAHKQWKTSEKQRKQGHKNEYLRVHKIISEALNKIIKEWDVSRETYLMLSSAYHEADFYLDNETTTEVEKLQTIASKAYKLKANIIKYRRKAERLNDPSEIERMEEKLDSFIEKLIFESTAHDHFKKHLKAS